MRETNSLRCLLDDDADAVKLASRRRLRSLAISISVQALFITVLVVAPLLAAGRIQIATEAPVPIFYGRPGPPHIQEERPVTEAGLRRPQIRTDQLTAPPVIPTGRPQPDEGDGAAPDVGTGAVGDSCPTCSLLSTLGPPPDSMRSGPMPPMPEKTTPAPIAKPVVVSTPIQEAKLIHRVDPTYPSLCRQARLEGTVVLRAIVGRDGTMRELTYVSGPGCFVQHSLNAVAQWRYRPTILNGGPVEVETSITVIYKLNR